jgi:hypothetical protein
MMALQETSNTTKTVGSQILVTDDKSSYTPIEFTIIVIGNQDHHRLKRFITEVYQQMKNQQVLGAGVWLSVVAD